MRISVLDANTQGSGTPLDGAIERFIATAQAQGDHCERVRLAGLKIHQCVGCFDCWMKRPGRCRLRDDGAQIVAAVAQSELLVFASTIHMGFTSALLKRATDRIVPLLTPYIELLEGECHHSMRYGRGLDVALLLERNDASDEDLRVVANVYGRLARNIRGKLAWVQMADASEEKHHAMDAR
jgi:hypothetical protein